MIHDKPSVLGSAALLLTCLFFILGILSGVLWLATIIVGQAQELLKLVLR